MKGIEFPSRWNGRQGMDLKDYRYDLTSAIENKARCAVTYLHTQPVKLVSDGIVLWKGQVEVFQLSGHPEAKVAYGWGVPNFEGKMEYFTVIAKPPLETPVAAVKAYLASRRD